MLRKKEYKIVKKLTTMVLLLSVWISILSFQAQPSFAVTSLQINFSGKIVTNDGLDISKNLPSCVNPTGADTCPFQIKYYNHVSDTPGTLLGRENFLNVELGDYRGYFNLKLGTGSFLSGTHSSLRNIFLNEEDVYIEVLFDKNFDGTGNPDFETTNPNLERFVVSQPPSLQRMTVGASPYSISSRGAIDEFQLKVKNSGTGTSAGLVYFDGGTNLVRVHSGSGWENLVYESILGAQWSKNNNDAFFLNGNVGIGLDNPTTRLSVLGDFSIDGRIKLNSLNVGSGSVVHYDSISGYLVDGSASSIHYKDDIRSYGPVLSKLNNLELVSFVWNERSVSSGQRDIGMVAESVVEHIPELVIYDSFGQVQGLKYDRMGIYAIAGLRELSSQLTSLRESLQEEKPIYTSSEELKLGTLVSRDFSFEEDNKIKAFEWNSFSLLGFVSELLENNEDKESEKEQVDIEGEDIIMNYSYHIVPYTGFGDYEILVSKPLDSDVGTIYPKGTPLSLGVFGDLVVLPDDNVSSLVLGYLLQDLEFAEDESSKLVKASISYSPLNFGFNSLPLMSLFNTSSSYNGLTIGGNLVNFHGKVGNFLIMNTDLLNISDRILIFVDDQEQPRINVDGKDVLERIAELEKIFRNLEK